MRVVWLRWLPWLELDAIDDVLLVLVALDVRSDGEGDGEDNGEQKNEGADILELLSLHESNGDEDTEDVTEVMESRGSSREMLGKMGEQ